MAPDEACNTATRRANADRARRTWASKMPAATPVLPPMIDGGARFAVCVVRATGTHEDSVRVAVSAVLAALTLFPSRPQWAQWAEGDARVMARIADDKVYRDLWGTSPHATHCDGLSSALAWIPMYGDHIPQPIRLLEDDGATLRRTGRRSKAPEAGTTGAIAQAIRAALRDRLAGA